MKDIKLAIGIPNTGVIKAQTAFCLCRMLKDFPHDYTVLFKEGSVLHWNREQLVEGAIKENCTHLLFLDSDMYFEKDAVLKLLERGKKVVGANYNTRKLPKQSTARLYPLIESQKPVDGKSDMLQLAESVATGFMLIDLSVFEKISKPWFFWKENLGEDYYFCEKVREVGIDVWCDLSIPIGHIGECIF